MSFEASYRARKLSWQQDEDEALWPGRLFRDKAHESTERNLENSIELATENTGRRWRLLLARYLRSRKSIPKDQSGEDSSIVVQMKLIMPTDQVTKAVCPSVFSALAVGYPSPHLLLTEHDGAPFNHIEKISMVNKFLQASVEDDELVVISDAHDVVFQLPPSTVSARFRQEGSQMVMASDKECWPPSDACNLLPESPLSSIIYGGNTGEVPSITRPRFLNSGVIVGVGSALKNFFSEALKIVDANAENKGVSDQGILLKVLTAEHSTWNYTLDYRNRISMTLKSSESDIEFSYGPHLNSPSSALDSPDLRKVDFTGLPLHADGNLAVPWSQRILARNKKDQLPQVLQRLKRGSSTPGGAGAWLATKWIGVTDLCDHLMQEE